ncbi:hypothetical protein M5W68_05625 [Paenibacillus larvae]|uniref:hypothetical protein n=1 Tax=Paenibacillus larvae TaxID=1464 RepID=UPI00227F8C08|nr:hypothetical protein [Paenibacillus larvae]MCY9508967.1 hypothetical protein [Paenibacillus larvae]MCY9524645.1 hypothetical protein [Paenibacillus larvae]
MESIKVDEGIIRALGSSGNAFPSEARFGGNSAEIAGSSCCKTGKRALACPKDREGSSKRSTARSPYCLNQ